MPFELGTLTYPVRPPEQSMLVVAKATFDLVHGSTARIAKPQRPLSGDTFLDDEADQSPVYPSDFAIMKGQGECFLLGSCRPAGNRAKISVAAFQVGAIQKAVGVFGDRRWKRGLLGLAPTEPEEFASMPLRWDRAYGGPKNGANPVGRGVAERVDSEGNRFRPLPNIESMLDPIGGPDDKPSPVGFGPIAAHWAARWKLGGSYGDRWLKTRAPFLPEDMHPSFFNQAAPDQRVRRHWAGNEDIVLKNVHPQRELFRSRLPGLRVRVFVESTAEAGAHFRELKMTLDTIVVDGEAGQALCVWRGLLSVRDASASDVARLFAFHEPFDVQTSFDACRDRLNANLLLMKLEEEGFRPRNPQEDIEAGTVALTRYARQLELGDDDSMDGATMALTRMLVRDGGAGDSTVISAGPAADAAAPDDDVVADTQRADSAADGASGEGEEVDEEYERSWRDLEAKLAGLVAPPPGEPPRPTSVEEYVAAVEAAASHDPPLEFAQEVEPEEDPGAAEEETPEPAAEGPTPDLRQRVIDAHAAGQPLEGDFEGVDLAGLELPGLNAAGVHLARAKMDRANLEGAVFDDAILIEASFDRAHLKAAAFERADLTQASLVGALANEANFDEAILAEADLSTANLEDARMRSTLLRSANLTEVIAHRAVFDEADLTRALLTGAKIRMASFVETSIYWVTATQIDLRGCTLENLRGGGAQLAGADLRETKASGAVLRESDLTEAMLSFSNFEGADFSRCVMTRAALGGCSLKSAVFAEAKLDHAEIIRSDLSHAIFVGANLENADLRGSCLYGAQAFNAQVSGVQLANALVEGSSFAPKLMR